MDREQEQRPTTSKDKWTSSLTDLNDKRYQKRMKTKTEETREGTHPLYPRNSNSYTKVTIRQGNGFREFRIHHLSKRKILVIPEEFISEELNVFVDPPYLALYIGEQEFYPLDEGRLTIPENEMKFRMTRRGPVQEFTLRPYSNDEIYCQGPHCVPAHHVPIVDLEKDLSPNQGISVKEYKSPLTFLNRAHYKPNSPRLRFKDDGTRRVYLSETDLEKDSDMLLSDEEYEVYTPPYNKKQAIQTPRGWQADFEPEYYHKWAKDEPLNYSRSDQDYRTPHADPRYQEFQKRYPEYKRSFSMSPRRDVPERALSPSRRKSIHPVQFAREPTFQKETTQMFPMGRSPRTLSPSVMQNESQYGDEPPLMSPEETPYVTGRTPSPRNEPMYPDQLRERTLPHSPQEAYSRRQSPARSVEPFFREQNLPPGSTSPYSEVQRTKSPTVRNESKSPYQFLSERTLPRSPQEGNVSEIRHTKSPNVKMNETSPRQFSQERTLPISPQEATYLFRKGGTQSTRRPNEPRSPQLPQSPTSHQYEERRTKSPTHRQNETKSPRQFSPGSALPYSGQEEAVPISFSRGPKLTPKGTTLNRLTLERNPSPVAHNDLANQYVEDRALSPTFKQTSSYRHPYNENVAMAEDSAPSSDNSNENLNSSRLDSPTYGMVKVTHSSTEVSKNPSPERRKSIDKVLLRIQEEMDPLKKQMVELHKMLKKEEKPKKKVKIRQEPLSAAPSQHYPKTSARFPSAAELVEEISKRIVAGTKETRGKMVNSERKKDFKQSMSRVPSSSRYHKSCIQSPEAVKLKKDKT